MSSSYYGSTYGSYGSSASSTAGVEGVLSAILGLGVFFWIVMIAAVVVVCVARWKVFKKANVDGWESLIPGHCDVVELQLGGMKTAWWFLNLVAICGIGPIVFTFMKSIALAKAFGKGTGFGIILALFPFVGYPILAWGSAQYVGNGVSTPAE